MAQYFKSQELSVFSGNMAMMIKAGITPTDAVSRLIEHPGDQRLKESLEKVYRSLIEDRMGFAPAVRSAGVFPDYMVNMISVGEEAGRLEEVLKSLSEYYGRRSHMEREVRTALIYPAVLLFLMAGVLTLMVHMVLPVFMNVYKSMTGSLVVSSYSYVSASVIIGRVGLYITLAVCALMVIFFIMSRTEGGSSLISRLAERFPLTRKISYRLALSQMSDFIATFIASGQNEDTAVLKTEQMVTNKKLKRKLTSIRKRMEKGETLSDAFSHEAMYDSVKTVMLFAASGVGSTEDALLQLADMTGDESENLIQNFLEIIEPVFTGFLTLVIGITLLSIMLPLIGMLGAIG